MTALLLPCLRLRVAGVLLCAGLFAPAVVAARARGPVSPAIIAAAPAAPVRVSFLPFDEVREGMTGYGLTVFHGTRIDTFGVRVIGVQKHARVAGGVIIVEVSGHGLEVSAIPQVQTLWALIVPGISPGPSPSVGRGRCGRSAA